MQTRDAVPTRGAGGNPPNRFEKLHLEPDPESDFEEPRSPQTQFLKDRTQSIVAFNDSPDVGFEASINPYRGCEHGCIYCYARPFHEYLGFSAGLDFETRIMVKEDAPQLLRLELQSPKWKPQVIAISGVTDCYQPVERKLKITRGCLEVLAEFRNPVAIVTKNFLVTRDIDILSELARHQAVAVYVSITTLNTELRRIMEPRTSPPAMRLEAIHRLSQAGIPTGVLMSPIISGLTDHEIPAVLEAAARAGAQSASHITLRLPYAVAPLFEQWLQTHFPEQKEKILNRVRAMRGGKLNDPRFGSRMRGEGIFADQIDRLFDVTRRKAGLIEHRRELSVAAFRRPQGPQLEFSLLDSAGEVETGKGIQESTSGG